MITAGGTQEPLDPVRFLTNASSGKMGVALAEAAHDLGASVALIHAPLAVALPPGVECIPVRTTVEMCDAVLARVQPQTDVLMARRRWPISARPIPRRRRSRRRRGRRI